jgi:cardiolipin synthase
VSAISRAALDRLQKALAAGRLRVSSGAIAIRAAGLDREAEQATALLRRFESVSMTDAQALVAVQSMLEQTAPVEKGPTLVWSALNAHGTRATSVVVRELFERAETSVLVTSFSLGQHKQREGNPIFAPLVDRMRSRSQLQVVLVVHVFREGRGRAGREPVDAAIQRFARAFAREQWPWEPRPRVYFDPRVLLQTVGAVSTHAKAVVVDGRLSLITSANLTEAAQIRNIEVGVLLDDESLASQLKAQFDALIAANAMQALPGFDR